MDTRRWLDRTQPQTLYMATVLLYLDAFFDAIAGYLGTPLGILLVAGQVGAGFGIANEKRWGYILGIVMAVAPFALLIMGGFGTDFITLMFQIALVVLLLHPQSREYQRIWFK